MRTGEWRERGGQLGWGRATWLAQEERAKETQ